MLVDAEGVMVSSRDPVKGEGEPRRWMAGHVVGVWSAKSRLGRDRDALGETRSSVTFPPSLKAGVIHEFNKHCRAIPNFT
jgi:hypothetical protein